jgi:hypothetical protein
VTLGPIDNWSEHSHCGTHRKGGVMDDVLARIWDNLGGRIGGPLSFRLLLQPVMAAFLAIRAGLKDARIGQPAYFWAILTGVEHRRALLHEGWKDVMKVFLLAVVLDVAYQVLVFRWVYPIEILIVAFLLACLPYLLIRGPVNRIAAALRRQGRPWR